MGLDMYLYLRKYESNFSDNNLSYPYELRELENNNRKRNFLSKDTRYQVGYWRKANAIHNWFVKNCANGEDDCKPIYVPTDKLVELLKLVKEVLQDHSKASELLPTCEGFFFGGQEYDEWYFNDLEYTKDLLEKVLDVIGKYRYDIYYQASW